MKRDIMLSIRSTQQFEGCDEEKIDLMTEARLYERGGKFYISYEESELTGLVGTRTTVKIDGDTITMMRTGTYSSEMLFGKNQRHVGLYHTEFGAMTISTHTNELKSTINKDGGQLEIDYTVEVDQSMVGHHNFKMVVKPIGEDLDENK